MDSGGVLDGQWVCAGWWCGGVRDGGVGGVCGRVRLAVYWSCLKCDCVRVLVVQMLGLCHRAWCKDEHGASRPHS